MPSTPMKTWGAETLTSSDMNTYLRDNIDYLLAQLDSIIFRAVQVTRTGGGSQAITTASATLITFTAESFDLGGWWSSGTDVVTPAGVIPAGFTNIGALCIGRIRYESNATGKRRVRLLKNGSSFGSTTVEANGTDETDILIVEGVTLAATDTVTLEAYQTSGGNLNAEVGNLTVIRLGPES